MVVRSHIRLHKNYTKWAQKFIPSWDFSNKDLVILEDEFKGASDKYVMMTDDGSYGEKGLVTDALEKLIQEGNQYDEVIAIGPLNHDEICLPDYEKI